MKVLQFYANGMKKCPHCGSTEFKEFWSGEDEDIKLIRIACRNCGQEYPSKEHFIKMQRNTNSVARGLHKINIPY